MSEHHGIHARVIADSTHQGTRLTTFEATFPRFVLAEFNTHRVLSRNSASSRAIPVWKRLVDMLEYPFVPHAFGKNKAGMQSAEMMSDADSEAARDIWLVNRDIAVITAYMLAGGEKQISIDSKGNEKAAGVCDKIKDLMTEYPSVARRMRQLSGGVHKQHANRVLEPFAYHTVIVTATDWRNFYALRASLMAQPEIQDLGIKMARVHLGSTPTECEEGDWHLPFIRPEDRTELLDPLKLARVSSAKCARVSYLTHEGIRSLEADLTMAGDLQGAGHMSPFEHAAKAVSDKKRYGNFGPGWMQYRKMLESEHDFSNFIKREDLVLGMKGDEALVDFVLSLAA